MSKFYIEHPLETKNIMCIYKLSFDSGLFYIGSTINLMRRIIQYRNSLYSKTGINIFLQAAANTHNSAKIEIIELITDRKIIREREEYHIKIHFDNPKNLNRNKWVVHVSGFPMTEEERYKCGNGMRGKKLTQNQLIKWSLAAKGRKHSDDTKKKLSELKKGFKFSDEHRKKLSEAKKGKKLTEDSKKIRSLKCTTKKKVDMFNIDGIFIKTFDSFKAAGKEVGLLSGHIGEVVNGKFNNRKGFIFKLHEKL
jgi:group I intron endonuclease